MKLIISESAEKRLIAQLVKEEMVCLADKVGLVKQFLDKNFLKASNSVIGDNGRPSLKDIVIMVDAYKQPKQYMSDVDLFYLLQDEFKDILPPDEVEQVEDIVNDEFNDAYKEAERQVKAVTHNKRDKFLKQCIKDWYYNKISKNNNLSIYEAIDRFDKEFLRNKNSSVGTFSVIGDAKFQYRIKMRTNKKNVYLNALDDSIDGFEIIKDINYDLVHFDAKRTKYSNPSNPSNKNKGMHLSTILVDAEGNHGPNSPDFFDVVQRIITSRGGVKWCFICPNLAKNINKSLLDDIKYKLTHFSPHRDNGCYFTSKEERDSILPFYLLNFKKYVTPFLLQNKDLQLEINTSVEMTPELNAKIEKYLDSVGFPLTGHNPEKFTVDDFSDFENFE